MTRAIILLLILISDSISYGQTVKTGTKKAEYKTNEKIEFLYEIDETVDSIVNMKQEGFYLTENPFRTHNTNTDNKIVTNVTDYICRIIAIKPGELKIPSPTFYVNGIAIKADSITFKITGEKLNTAELNELEYDIFKKSSISPDGTIKATYSDKYGFIEKYYNSEWRMVRQLTNKEIRKYKKLEKIIRLND